MAPDTDTRIDSLIQEYTLAWAEAREDQNLVKAKEYIENLIRLLSGFQTLIQLAPDAEEEQAIREATQQLREAKEELRRLDQQLVRVY